MRSDWPHPTQSLVTEQIAVTSQFLLPIPLRHIVVKDAKELVDLVSTGSSAASL